MQTITNEHVAAAIRNAADYAAETMMVHDRYDARLRDAYRSLVAFPVTASTVAVAVDHDLDPATATVAIETSIDTATENLGMPHTQGHILGDAKHTATFQF